MQERGERRPRATNHPQIHQPSARAIISQLRLLLLIITQNRVDRSDDNQHKERVGHGDQRLCQIVDSVALLPLPLLIDPINSMGWVATGISACVRPLMEPIHNKLMQITLSRLRLRFLQAHISVRAVWKSKKRQRTAYTAFRIFCKSLSALKRRSTRP